MCEYIRKKCLPENKYEKLFVKYFDIFQSGESLCIILHILIY